MMDMRERARARNAFQIIAADTRAKSNEQHPAKNRTERTKKVSAAAVDAHTHARTAHIITSYASSTIAEKIPDHSASAACADFRCEIEAFGV